MIINATLPPQISAHKLNAGQTPPGKSPSHVGPGGATSAQLSVSNENLTAAQSPIQDAGMAEESTRYAAQNILTRSATAMLAQANSLPQSVLKLLQ
jgi:hypothetical protein